MAKVESDHTKADLEKVVPFLQVEMLKDEPFAQEIQTLAQEFNQEINISNSQDNTVMNQDNSGNAKGFQVKANEVGHIGDVNNPG